ncbi:MAG: hypothetical protein R8K20_11885 [Gallionellaceae bacterium]
MAVKEPKKKTRHRRPNAVKASVEQLIALIDVVGNDGISLMAAYKASPLASQTAYKSIMGRIALDDELSRLYARAREEYADRIVERMYNIADEEKDIQRARLKVDIIKWEAGKVRPKKYGDKQIGTEDDPLVIKTIQRVILSDG